MESKMHSKVSIQINNSQKERVGPTISKFFTGNLSKVDSGDNSYPGGLNNNYNPYFPSDIVFVLI